VKLPFFKIRLLTRTNLLGRLLSASALLALTACGGGNSATGIIKSNSDWNAGVYQKSSSFENYCETPRAGVSKITGIPFPDRKGSRLKPICGLKTLPISTQAIAIHHKTISAV
jgi:carboxyl-terminal processing protease